MDKINPEVFRLAATYLQYTPGYDAGVVGCCAAVQEACKELREPWGYHAEVLYNTYRAYGMSAYWWHNGDPLEPTRINQEERFIALNLLAEMYDE